MIESEIVFMVANTGFAGYVAIYSLTRLEKTIQENTRAINDLQLSLTGGHSHARRK